LIFLDTPFTYEPIAWAIRKNDPDFLNWLSKLLYEIKADERFVKMHDKWFKITDWFQYVRGAIMEKGLLVVKVTAKDRFWQRG
jgi:polar amino acid transport system substrate-binding protein